MFIQSSGGHVTSQTISVWRGVYSTITTPRGLADRRPRSGRCAVCHDIGCCGNKLPLPPGEGWGGGKSNVALLPQPSILFWNHWYYGLAHRLRVIRSATVQPTNHLNAYNNALMGFPQRCKAQQACSVVLATSFVDRQNGL